MAAMIARAWCTEGRVRPTRATATAAVTARRVANLLNIMSQSAPSRLAVTTGPYAVSAGLDLASPVPTTAPEAVTARRVANLLNIMSQSAPSRLAVTTGPYAVSAGLDLASPVPTT